VLPSAECLKDVVERMLPYWYDSIVPDLGHEKCVLVSAHGNSLRALVKHLDNLTDQQVVDLDIPTGVPRVYELNFDFTTRSSRYLGDPNEIQRRAAAVRNQASQAR
jgi:2,3-bisphosphoglycerate-dependent phosphoglycerate mutase